MVTHDLGLCEYFSRVVELNSVKSHQNRCVSGSDGFLGSLLPLYKLLRTPKF
ncbi:MAG: hypothetical protein K6B18_12795 [Ruminococcus sp.]|nr:hypothetical protein [Ruminococcus sp.]